MSERKNPRQCSEELRIGSSGVPLALAPDLYRKVLINREQLKKACEQLQLSRYVGMRMVKFMRRHGLPSRDRLICLSIGYPDRTFAEIASAFGVSVDYVAQVEARTAELRRAEPLSSELWEDICEDTPTQQQLADAAAKVREKWSSDELVQRQVFGSPAAGPRSRAGVGGQPTHRGPRGGARRETDHSRPQPARGFLPHPGLHSGRPVGDKSPRPDVYLP